MKNVNFYLSAQIIQAVRKHGWIKINSIKNTHIKNKNRSMTFYKQKPKVLIYQFWKTCRFEVNTKKHFFHSNIKFNSTYLLGREIIYSDNIFWNMKKSYKHIMEIKETKKLFHTVDGWSEKLPLSEDHFYY